jgi:hypothetical protein
MKAKPIPTRLNEAQVVDIATRYVSAQGLGTPHTQLLVQDVRASSGTVVWTLRTPTVGRWLTVAVDDATGEAMGHHVHGIR